jgi:hypothetical protein
MGADGYGLHSELLGPLPVINHFLTRMGLTASLERFVRKSRCRPQGWMIHPNAASVEPPIIRYNPP